MTINAGSVIGGSDSYKFLGQGVDAFDGRQIYRAIGVAILTDTAQTQLAVNIYSNHSRDTRSQYPPIPILLPANSEILSVSLRLPRDKELGVEATFGKYLPASANMIGTATDVLKVSTVGANAFTQFATLKTAGIICNASGVYQSGSSNRLTRKTASADDAAGILTTVTIPTQLNLVVTNAAGTAAGSGISLSQAGANALIPVDVIFALPLDPVYFHDVVPNVSSRSLFLP